MPAAADSGHFLTRNALDRSTGYQFLQLGQQLPLLGIDFHVRIGERKNLFVFRRCDLMILDGLIDHSLQSGGFTAEHESFLLLYVIDLIGITYQASLKYRGEAGECQPPFASRIPPSQAGSLRELMFRLLFSDQIIHGLSLTSKIPASNNSASKKDILATIEFLSINAAIKEKRI
jgi:hypothetical protein